MEDTNLNGPPPPAAPPEPERKTHRPTHGNNKVKEFAKKLCEYCGNLIAENCFDRHQYYCVSQDPTTRRARKTQRERERRKYGRDAAHRQKQVEYSQRYRDRKAAIEAVTGGMAAARPDDPLARLKNLYGAAQPQKAPTPAPAPENPPAGTPAPGRRMQLVLTGDLKLMAELLATLNPAISIDKTEVR